MMGLKGGGARFEFSGRLPAGDKRRPWLLGGVVALLAVLLWLDQSTPGAGKPGAAAPAAEKRAATARAAAPAGPLAQLDSLQHWRLLAQNRARIAQRYQENALTYAESVGALLGFGLPAQLDEAAVRALLAANLPPEIKINSLVAGVPAAGPQGSHSLPVRLNLSSGNSQAMLAALAVLGDAGSGSVWQELDLRASAEEASLHLEGQIVLLLMEPAE